MNVMLIRYHDLDNVNTRLAESLNKRQGVLPPLGLAYIASSLELAAGHSVFFNAMCSVSNSAITSSF